MDLSSLKALQVDTVTGIGVLRNVYEREVKNKEKTEVIGTKLMVEISKLNAVLSLETDQATFTALTAQISTKALVKEQSFVKYEAELSLEADAFAYGDQGKAMATSKYSTPILTFIDKAK